MTIKEWQTTVDNWIKEYGVRYFNEMTNTLVLVEEVGEFARIMAREYGEQSWKRERDRIEAKKNIKKELADIIFVTTCLANQMDIDMTEILEETIIKKTKRDHDRHKKNQKL